eukprot:25061-Prymnesium_polylepis.2
MVVSRTAAATNYSASVGRRTVVGKLDNERSKSFASCVGALHGHGKEHACRHVKQKQKSGLLRHLT